ncbi:glycosyltransferase family 2 protein [Aequorivita lipolytica]|uniref:Glycosyltransferase family 2 protein n=1 Tax=Aequorivita lipolytica TaxID=153267 RepID=A0A5C6YPS5_9FLAO|nr:glycosyltransferase family 2 protein [Aequorivita lipolytica]TXD68876.1 glycosyltransferase family 2 protein [Aequorivita lipolytica]SRX52137.1 N-acetylglucosaminyl-diphospho-decaprenol L-rhamnosyltransferase [Aequorivita lipolytica]
MKAAVVILNWNGKDLLEKFLPSVVKFSNQANIYLADNASTDSSVSFVTEFFPSVKVIQNKVNGGYAKGYNDALKNLSEKIFVLLNSDVEVTEDWLQPVISEFEKDVSVVAAQPKILDYKNKGYFEYAGAAGGFIDEYGYPYCRGRIFNTLEKDEGQYNDISEIFWASGACLFVKAGAFWQAGGFDEDYFAHQEEIDLCWRLQSKGGKILYVGNSKVYHVGGATLAVLNPQKTFYNFRNSLLNLLKNANGTQAFTSILMRMLLDGIAAFQFLVQGKPQHFLAVIKAHFSFYGFIPKFLQKRRIHASELKYFSVKSIVFQYFIKNKKVFNEL